MISVLVIIEGDLGRLIVDALDAKVRDVRVHRCNLKEAQARRFAVDLTIIDRTVGEGPRWALVRAQHAPLFVVGEDIEMPFDVAKFVQAIIEAAANRGGERDDELIAIDPPLRTALRVIEQAAKRRSGVLITGPTGVGKELLAQRLHVASRRKGPLVALNCAALPAMLADTALFGHVRGAFTGAVSTAKGAFVEADRGTLFLDEIGELEASVQGKLLRALEEGKVRAVGAARDVCVDVRVVAATNRPLEAEMATKRFRNDLYYRLATFHIAVPPLRVRPRDLDALIDRFHSSHDRGGAVAISSEARQILQLYAWPGNVRELRNVLERVLSLASGDAVSAETLVALAPELAGLADTRDPGEVASLRQALSEVEGEVIREFLASGKFERQQLAHRLGIHRSTLWRKMKRIMSRDHDGVSSTSPDGPVARRRI
ncbi:sigma 54-interacting transcriptional regulator [Pendulispora rubella]|uniref:Sigma 54-interacting transcriptional regulator n=1 Tax=Pendulispora rubella TaxID=2741070 RepID=A0ABZ2KX62_9BACT